MKLYNKWKYNQICRTHRHRLTRQLCSWQVTWALCEKKGKTQDLHILIEIMQMSVMRRKKYTGISLLNPDSWHHWRAQIHLSTRWQRVIKTEFAETLTPSLFFEWRFAINSLQRLCRKHINKRSCNKGIYSKCECRKLLFNWLAWCNQCLYSKWWESAMTSKTSWII